MIKFKSYLYFADWLWNFIHLKCIVTKLIYKLVGFIHLCLARFYLGCYILKMKKVWTLVNLYLWIFLLLVFLQGDMTLKTLELLLHKLVNFLAYLYRILKVAWLSVDCFLNILICLCFGIFIFYRTQFIA